MNRSKLSQATLILAMGLLATGPLPANASLAYSQSSVGNSFTQGLDGKSVQDNIAHIWVKPADGTVYTVSQWDENKYEGGMYRAGDRVGRLADLHPNEGGASPDAVTGDNAYVYVGNGKNVRRYSFSGAHASFPGAIAGPNGKGYEVAVCTSGQIVGLAADKVNKLLYVSGDADNLVSVIDLDSTHANFMKVIRSWPVLRPWRCAVGSDGTLWIIQKSDTNNPAKVLRYDTNGNKLPQEITGLAGFNPPDIAFDNSGRLMVADNGPDMQIKIYTDLAALPAMAAAFGANGGIYSGTAGQVAPLKFNWITGIGVDAVGNIYVAQNRFGPEVNSASSGGGSILQAYNPAGALIWQVLGLEFVDCAAVDYATAGSVLDVYSKLTHYQLDMTQADGHQWIYKGHTLNQLKYPKDERYLRRLDNFDFCVASFVRYIGGRKFLFNTSMWGSRLELYRFASATDGEVAIPCGYFAQNTHSDYAGSPTGTEFIWTDSNGDGTPDPGEYESPASKAVMSFDGWFVDVNGDVWNASPGSRIRRFPNQGLNGCGAPLYSYTTALTYTKPASFASSEIKRIEFIPGGAGQGTVYLAGYTTAYPKPTSGYNEKSIGKVIAKYTLNPDGTFTSLWESVIPDFDRTPASMRVEGDFVFVAYDGNAYTPDSGYVRIFRASDGRNLGKIWAGDNNNGRVDVEYGVSAVRRANGEYLIFVEDDWYAKLTMYRWTPPASTPAAPVLTATSGNTMVYLSWTDLVGTGVYSIERATSPTGPFAVIASEVESTSFVDTGAAVTNGLTYYYRIVAHSPAGDAPYSSVQAAAPSASLRLAINCGGDDEPGGWCADMYYSEGTAMALATSNPNTNSVHGAAPANVYKTERVYACTYTIPQQAPGGAYQVRLHFDEFDATTYGPNRYMNVTINGVQVLTNFNIYRDVGNHANYADIKEFTTCADSGGNITIGFESGPSGGNPIVSGIELLPLTVTMQFSGGKLVLTWPSGVLLETTNLVTGPWTTSSITPPFTNTPSGRQKFFRAQK